MRLYLTEWREHFKVSQEELGGRMETATTYRWELWTREPGHEDARQPDVNTLAAFAEALGISVIDLYRPPTNRQSLDAMAAKATEARQDMAFRVLTELLRD